MQEPIAGPHGAKISGASPLPSSFVHSLDVGFGILLWCVCPEGAWQRDAFEIRARNEGYGLQPVRKQRKIIGALAPEGMFC